MPVAVLLPSGNVARCTPLCLQDYLEAQGRLGDLAARVVGLTSDEVDEWLDEGDQSYALTWAAENLSEEDAVSLAYLARTLRIVPSQYLAIPEPVPGFFIDRKVATTMGKLEADEYEQRGSGSPTADVGYMEDPI